MKTIKIILLISFFFIYLIALAFTDTTITNFFNSTNDSIESSTNISFDQAESNISVYLQVPKNSTVTSAEMNVSGFKNTTGEILETLRPNADGTIIIDWDEWDIAGTSPANTRWESVDEVTTDEDVTYVNASSIGEIIFFNIENSTKSGTIDSITVNVQLKHDVGYEEFRIKIYTYSTEYDNGADIADTTSYTNYSNTWGTNPNTLAAWTWTEIDALEIGIESAAAGAFNGELRVTQIWLEVTGAIYPTNLTVDVGDDGKNDYTMTGELNSTNSPTAISDLNTTAIQNYVDTNNADASGYVYVPLNITSDTAGIVELSVLSVYADDTATANFLSTSDPSADANQTRNWFFVNVSTDRNQSNFTLEINSTQNYTMNMVNDSSNSYGYYNATGLDDDQYDVIVYVQGNNSVTRTIIIDNTAPNSITVVSPVDNYNSSSTSILFNFTATDALTALTFNITIDGVINESDQSLTNNTYNSTNKTFTEGSHNWSIKVWDILNNSNTSATYNFTIDLTAPATFENESASPTSFYERAEVTLSIDVTDALTDISTVLAEVTDPGGVKANHTMSGSGDTYTVSFSGTDTDRTGDYYVDFYANDSSGNSNFSNKDLKFTVDIATGAGGGDTGGGGGGGISVPDKDSDKDGVPDYRDKCPKTPETVLVDRDGCELDEDRIVLPTPLELPDIVDNFYIFSGENPYIRIIHANKELVHVESSNPKINVSIVNKTDIKIYYFPSNLTSLLTLVEGEVKATSLNPDTRVMKVFIRVIDTRTDKITAPYFKTRPITPPKGTLGLMGIFFILEDGVIKGIRWVWIVIVFLSVIVALLYARQSN